MPAQSEICAVGRVGLRPPAVRVAPSLWRSLTEAAGHLGLTRQMHLILSKRVRAPEPCARLQTCAFLPDRAQLILCRSQ